MIGVWTLPNHPREPAKRVFSFFIVIANVGKLKLGGRQATARTRWLHRRTASIGRASRHLCASFILIRLLPCHSWLRPGNSSHGSGICCLSASKVATTKGSIGSSQTPLVPHPAQIQGMTFCVFGCVPTQSIVLAVGQQHLDEVGRFGPGVSARIAVDQHVAVGIVEQSPAAPPDAASTLSPPADCPSAPRSCAQYRARSFKGLAAISGLEVTTHVVSQHSSPHCCASAMIGRKAPMVSRSAAEIGAGTASRKGHSITVLNPSCFSKRNIW